MKKILLIIALVIIIASGALYLFLRFDIFAVPGEEVSVEEPNSPAPEMVGSATYMCRGDMGIGAIFYETPSNNAPAVPGQPPVPTGSVSLALPSGEVLALSQTISADGARYANAGESFIFWSKGNGAIVLENNEEKTYVNCIAVKPESAEANLPGVYANGSLGFSLRLPSISASGTDGYTVDESFKNQLSPDKIIYGVKFTIPLANATGTNLSRDSYLSVEQIPNTDSCTADIFFDGTHGSSTLQDGDTTYSYATSSNAGAGNRYEEFVYALPGTNPCVAVRYMVHYSVFENYPEGAVKEFDFPSVIKEFDTIRHTLVVNQ